jgi:hypothetical protein
MVVMGLVIVFANRTAETPRLFSEGWGWLFVLVGLTAALAHAAAETDLLVRRLIGLVGSLLVFVGVVLGMVMSGRGRSWALGLIPALPGRRFDRPVPPPRDGCRTPKPWHSGVRHRWLALGGSWRCRNHRCSAPVCPVGLHLSWFWDFSWCWVIWAYPG